MGDWRGKVKTGKRAVKAKRGNGALDGDRVDAKRRAQGDKGKRTTGILSTSGVNDKQSARRRQDGFSTASRPSFAFVFPLINILRGKRGKQANEQTCDGEPATRKQNEARFDELTSTIN